MNTPALARLPRGRALVACAALLGAGAGLGAWSWWRAEARAAARHEAMHAAAVGFSQRTGISFDASYDGERLVAFSAPGASWSDREFRDVIDLWRRHQGRDRVSVAKYTIGFFFDAKYSAAHNRLTPAQEELARMVTTEILMELGREPDIAQVSWNIAASLGLHTDPALRELAAQAIADPALPRAHARNIASGFLNAGRPAGPAPAGAPAGAPAVLPAAATGASR